MSGTNDSTSGEPKGPLTVGEAQERLSALLAVGGGDGLDVLDRMEAVDGKESRREPRSQSQEDAGDDDDDLLEVPEDDEEEPAPADDRDEEELEEDEDEAPQEPSTYKVKIDGKVEEVTLDELLSGYSRTADYTRKTQALSAEKKTVEQEAAQTRAAREDYAARLAEVARLMEEMSPKEPDWDRLQVEDPARFAQVRAQWNLWQERKDRVRHEQERVQQQQMKEFEAAREERIRDEQKKLLEKIPALKDREKGPKVRDEMVNYALGLGFTEEDISATVDHRMFEILHKAMRYDKLQQRKANIREKAKKAPVLKPGQPKQRLTRQKKAVKHARERLSETGRVEDAARLLFNMDIE